MSVKLSWYAYLGYNLILILEKFNDSQNAIKYCDDALNKHLPLNLRKLFDSIKTKLTKSVSTSQKQIK